MKINGYIPQVNPFKDLIYKCLGFPLLIRRMQYPFIRNAMNYKSQDSVLDVGCGPGWMSWDAVQMGSKEVVGIDFEIAEGHHYLEKLKGNLKFYKGDINQPIIQNKKFNKILLSSVLQLVEDDRALLNKCRSLLTSDGTMVITVPIDYPIIKKIYSKPFLLKIFPNLPNTYEDFTNLCSSRFNIIGKGYYSVEQIQALLKSCEFKIKYTEYIPRFLGGSVFQLLILLRFVFKCNKLTSKFDFLLMPIMFFDRFLSSPRNGIELMIVVQR